MNNYSRITDEEVEREIRAICKRHDDSIMAYEYKRTIQFFMTLLAACAIAVIGWLIIFWRFL